MWRRESFRKITILWLWMKSWWEQLSLIRVQKFCTFQYLWFQGRKQSNSAKNGHPSLGGSFSITVNGENKTWHTQSCDATGNTHHLWGILAKNVPLEPNRGLNHTSTLEKIQVFETEFYFAPTFIREGLTSMCWY